LHFGGGEITATDRSSSEIKKIKNMNKKELIVYRRKLTELNKIHSNLKINSQTKLLEAKNFRLKLKEAINQVKSKRDEIINPLKISIKKTQEFFNPIIYQLTDMDQSVRAEMENYLRKQEEAIEKKKQEIVKKVETGKVSFEKAGKIIQRSEEKIKAVQTRVIPKLVVVSKKDIPIEYLEPNIPAIKRAINEGKKVPGVKVVYEKIIVNK